MKTQQCRRIALVGLLLGALLTVLLWHPPPAAAEKKDVPRLPAGVPAKVAKVLKYVDEHDRAPEGYVGGRRFENRERKLPKKDDEGKSITYREWDVNPKVRGKDRGPERLVTGSDGSAYYSSDHYKHFKKIR